MLTYLAIAEHLRPRYIVWENVPGVLSSNGGKDFGSFLGGLGELGYGWAYRVLDAQWCRTHRHPRAVPQRRRRVFVVGCLGNPTSAAKVLFERESMQRYSAPRRATRQGTAADVEESVGSGEKLVADVATVGALCARDYKGVGNQYVQENKCIPCWWDGDNTAGTLTKSNANGAQRMPDKDNFGAVLQPVAMAAFTKSKRAQSKTDNETWVEGVVAPTQNAFDVGDIRATTVAIPIMPQAMQAEGWRVGKENQDGRGNGLGVGKDGDPCPTLDRSAVPAIAYSFDSLASNSMKSSNPVSGCNVVNVAKCLDTSIPCPSKNQGGIAVAIQGTVIGRQDHNGPQGSGHSDSGEMFTLNSTDVHAVAVAPQEITAFQSSELRLRGTLTNQDVAPTLKSETKSGDTELRVLGTTMQVRRLTPTECERLQGFPDDWTKIPWKKKPADQCPDGPRYKALGNSMAVNCMEWLGERIQAVTNGN